MFAAIEFSSFGEFIDMGGYGFNVWAVYGLFTVFIVANLLAPRIKRRSILREHSRRLRMQEVIEQERSQADT